MLTGQPVSVKGQSDLTLGERKFSGNAQYRKREYVLVHGTFLLHFDLLTIERYLKTADETARVSPQEEP